MLLPRIHAWAPLRKWLVVIAAAIALAAFGALVYNYERYHRGPTDSVLVGTWEVPVWPGLGDVYFRLDADHTFHISHDFRDEQSEFDHGVWHAGGDFAYLR